MGSAAKAEPALKDGEKGVIIQRDRKTYAIVPHFRCGILTSSDLRRIADVADKFGCQAIKLTNAQRIALIGLREDQIDAAWAALEMPKGPAIGDCVRSVKACPGTTFCKRAQQDSIALGYSLDRLFLGKPMPAKVKIGVSGCPNQCSETAIKDIGLVGFRKGWEIWIGGSGGVAPRLATRFARELDEERVIAVVDGLLDYYSHHGKPKERFHKFITRVGLGELARLLGLPLLEAPMDAQYQPNA